LDGVPLVPYRLPELLSGCDPVFICEGEKDVDNLRTLGLTATCNPMGAGKWKSIYDRNFGGRTVVILPDNDTPGKDHAKQVSRSLKGMVQSVKIVELPGLPEKGDVSDFLAPLTDVTKEDFLRLINLEELERKDETKTDDYHFISGNELLAMPKPEVEWVLDGIIDACHLGLVLGKPKDGKTYFTFNLAVHVSRGTPFLGRETTQGPVLYLALDQDEVQKYMRMMGGDFSNIEFHYGMAPTDAVGKLIKKIEEKSPRLVVVDILQKLVRMKDEKAYAEAITKLEPLSDVASRFRCSIVLNHHSPKQEREIVDAALGTTGYIASVGTAILIKKDHNERRSFYTLQREHKLGEKDIKGQVIDLAEDGITLIHGGTILDVQTQETKDQILKVLANLPEGQTLTASEIVSSVKRDRNFVIKCLDQLEQEFKIRKSGHGRRNNPYRFSLREERNL
jgi:DNA primase